MRDVRGEKLQGDIQRFKILASFCGWAGWFEPYLVANPQRHIFAICNAVMWHALNTAVVPLKSTDEQMWRVKRICVFEHSVMTNFICACPVIQRGQGSVFLSEGFSLLVWASSGGSGKTARMCRLAWTFAARIGDNNQIRLTRPKLMAWHCCPLTKVILWNYDKINK